MKRNAKIYHIFEFKQKYLLKLNLINKTRFNYLYQDNIFYLLKITINTIKRSEYGI
jgi:hypothetical protein